MHRTRPSWLQAAPLEQIASIMTNDIVRGFEACPGIHAGIIGELAIEGPDSIGIARIEDLGTADLKLLRAGALAQAATGASVSIHLPHSIPGGDSPERLALGILDVLEEAGADLSRVILGHIDRSADWTGTQLCSLAARGAVIEFDEWGLEGYVDNSDHVNPFDEDRIRWSLELVRRGFSRQVVWSHDIYLQHMLKKNGGPGYSHISEHVIPRVRRRGLDDAKIATIMVGNPRRLLTLKSPSKQIDWQPATRRLRTSSIRRRTRRAA
jgi:phosphotriesterase-related protein